MNDEGRRMLTALAVANSLLMLADRVTPESIDRTVRDVGQMPSFEGLDLNRLKKELETANNVHVGAYSVLDDKEYRAWIAAKREGRDFLFWNRYKQYLERKKGIPRSVVDQIDRLTDDIIDRLRDPETPGSWDRRGLVVGDVQSGKTSNYTGLVCKAVDAGYRLIIVLAGLHNSLRSQTQQRLDEGFLGFDTRFNLKAEHGNQRIGAGALPGASLLIAHSLTSSTDSGDFQRGTAERTRIIPGGQDPVVLVVKKRVSILENLKAWVLSVRAEDDKSIPGGRIVRGVPFLIIDDEADNASANTNQYLDQNGNPDPDADPSRTNKLIRQLLAAFEKSAYVGYTATPFANVFMHHEAVSKDAGKDLFPSSFIINLPAPSNYIGADKVFGIHKPDGEFVPGLPILEEIDDADSIFPLKHGKDLLVRTIPGSLKKAMRSFVLACAARRARNDVDVHNSMLVHVTRFQDVQSQVARLLEQELVDMRRQLEYPGSGGDLERVLQQEWETEFGPTARAIASELEDHDLEPVTWGQVRPQLFNTINRIRVREINGSAGDVLDYLDNPKGLSVIAVGGDKLSRGLTLEGLSISYFLRTSRMYDTLLQMGRWFGYRPRYADLCRLFTSPELIKAYRHIALATAELRDEFDVAIASGATPLEFGHRVRTHPDGVMMITATNKMRSGSPVRAGFSGSISETVSFELDQADWNFEAIDSFLAGLGPVRRERGRYIWKEVEGAKVAALFARLKTSRESWKADAKALSTYIGERVSKERLKSWTVVLLASGKSPRSASLGECEVSLTVREDKSNREGMYTIGRLVSPADELLDLTGQESKQALDETIKIWSRKKDRGNTPPTQPSGPAIRRARKPTNGLLLLYPVDPEDDAVRPLVGFGVSFPEDKEAPLTDYAENSVRQLASLFE